MDKEKINSKKGIRRPSNTEYSDCTDHYSEISDTPRTGTVITGKGRGSPASVERGWDLGKEFEPLLQPSFIQPLVDKAISDLRMDHERARELQDQEKRKLIERMKEVSREEVDTSRPVPSPRVHDGTKRWTPQKEAAIENARNTLFSSQNQEKVEIPKKTDEMRGALSGNMSNLEQTHKDLNKRLSTMGLESDQEGEGTMLSLTTHLATNILIC